MNDTNKFLYCSPKVSLGEKFKYQIFNRKELTLIDMYGMECYFEDASRIVLEVVDFFAGKTYEYKIRFVCDGEVRLTKWYFEHEIVTSLDRGDIFNI